MKARDVSAAVKSLSNKEKAQFLSRFFKTGKGEYAEGDVFAGLPVPLSRKIAKDFQYLELGDIKNLLFSAIHEERLIALFILRLQYNKGTETMQQRLVDFYLKNLKQVNNWDLVDASAPYLLGDWLRTKDRAILYQLAKSSNLWERRVAIVSTFAFIKAGDSRDTFAISEILLSNRHDLIHKAVGWMLREAGKRVDMDMLRSFLARHASKMPRTTLRYAIERMPQPERKYWLQYGKSE